MLYIYDKQTRSLLPCKETEFSSHDLLERQDLAKWVEQNPTILGEDLLIITSEYDRMTVLGLFWLQGNFVKKSLHRCSGCVNSAWRSPA